MIFHEVPRDLVINIGIPQEGYKYVRVARDILLIAAGTAMVIDAIEDLGRIQAVDISEKSIMQAG